jgi:hypothetical protein
MRNGTPSYICADAPWRDHGMRPRKLESFFTSLLLISKSDVAASLPRSTKYTSRQITELEVCREPRLES